MVTIRQSTAHQRPEFIEGQQKAAHAEVRWTWSETLISPRFLRNSGLKPDFFPASPSF
ncbi:MAG: hypothetical protein JNK09_03180 [Prolixibacteraceae bacterium]|nr:hypothetical protein [Prolixibacteraceae bacterium]